MNAFAKGVFDALLSWLRGASQRLWRLFSSGGKDGFLTWLGDHWLLVIIFLCILGTVIDYAVWLFRWRPDLAWRTRWRHFMARMRGEEMRRKDTHQFAQGYQDGEFLQEYVGKSDPSENTLPEPETADIIPPAQPFATENAEQRPYVRQYRSSGKKKASIIRQWVEGDEDRLSLDGLPMKVDQRQAFHDPVYPEKIDPNDY